MKETKAPSLPTPEDTFEMYKPQVESSDADGALPMLTICTRGKLNLIALALEMSPREIMAGLLARFTAEEGQPDWITFSSEAWTQKPSDRIPGMDLSMQDLHKAGDTSVHETVLIIGMSKTEEWHYNRGFIRSPDGVTWSEAQIFHAADATASNHSGGPLADIFRKAVRG